MVMTAHYSSDADLSWLPAVQAAWAAPDLVEPPIWVTQRAKRLFHTVPAPGATAAETAPAGPPRPLERLRATLLFDSRRAGPAAAGVRALGPFDEDSGPWQLLYRGGDVDVDLLVRPNQDGHTAHVRGQALSLVGASVGAGSVEALPADAPRALRGATRPAIRSELQPSGEFALPNLERGRYDVRLHIGAREIELSDVEL
jgi:hypothetical protein